MLNKLVIKNVALIDSAEIVFTEGLNVLSGETGAGKYIILESLNFVLGAKADKTFIRSGEQECLVKVEFFIGDNSLVKELLGELEIEYDDVLLISRKLNIEGKSSIKINGETASVGMLKRFSNVLVDFHAQSEHFFLLKNSNQLALLDNFAGEKCKELKNKISEYLKEIKSIYSKLNELGGDQSQRLIRLDILNYQINEILQADIKEGEEDELLLIKQKLAHQKKITDALNLINSCISEESGILDILSNVNKTSNSIADISSDYLELSDRLESVYSELDDISSSALDLLDGFDHYSYNQLEIEDRLEVIKSIKKKYGNDFNEILEFLNKTQSERDRLENFSQLNEELQDKLALLKKHLYSLYNKLSNIRKETAKQLTVGVESELRELAMQNAKFEIQFSSPVSIDECEFTTVNDFDKIDFMFSANNGEPLKPLSNVISGGEMSRFMLSLKAQTSKISDTSTFIFDEIDAGISGITAKVVSEKLAKISKNVQVISISHLPQISAMADNNLLIEKRDLENRTITTVKTLNTEEKISEIVRLISGFPDSESSKAHAKELILSSNSFKKNL